jgi:aromatic ring-cleaving dioxygenase
MRMLPQGKVKIEWSPGFAYAVGLIATDGCMSCDGRHIVLVSKDLEMIENFRNCLNLDNKIGDHVSGMGTSAFRVQFGDVVFYDFLLHIGLSPKKSKTLKSIAIPDKYFFDFLRGCLDGDGTFYSYWDPRWASSFMFYTVFISASKSHIEWLRYEILRRLGICGHLTISGKSPMYEIKYAKSDSLQLLPKLYYNREVVCLSRKRLKIEKALNVEGKQLS